MSRIYGVNANRTDINKTEYLKLTGNCKENKIQGGNCPMKKSRSFIHYGKVLLIFAILMLVPFTGCKNIFVPESPATPEAAGSGGGITVTLRLFTGSARTVMPEYTETGSLNWKITASQIEGETVVEASGAYPDYTLSLPSAGSWTFTVSGNNSDGQEIFTGSVSMEITGTTATVSIPLSPGSAMTTGTGKISLPLTVPDTVKEVMYKLDPDGAFGELTSGNDNIYTLEKADVSAGTHTLSLYFLDGDGTTLYMCKETVNVWGGMTSDQWINTGNSAYINGEGKFELTEDIIDEFLETMGSVVYVNGDSGSDGPDGVGSIFAPVKTVSKAVGILRKVNPGENYSATIMVSGETTIDQEIEVNSGKTLTVKGTGTGASITNGKGRVFNITGGSLTLGENITLTGTVTDNNGGAVYVDGGTFTMNDGSKITGSSATGTMSYGGAVFIYKKGTFNMNGGVIGGSGDKEKNTAVCGGGVYVFTDGIFNMSGNAQIRGNEATGTDESSGGGVYVNGGKFSMEGSAIIQGNKAATTGDSVQYGGGGVYVNGGKFTMTGKAEIKDNQTTGKSGTGGGVHIWNSNFTMGDDTCIESNSTEHGGGGVYLGSFSTFTMYGNARIMSNNVEGNADVYGGGVSVNTNSSFTIIDKDSSISIKNNTIKGTNTYGGGVFVNNKTSVKFTVNGNPTITGNTANGNADNNVYLGSGKTITIGDGGLTGGTIGVTAENMNVGTEILSDADSAEQCRIFKLSGAIDGETIWWIEYNSVDSSGILKSATATTVSGNKATVSGKINNEEDLQDWMEASASAGVEVEITGGGNVTVNSPVSVPDGADVTIKPGSGNSVNITADGETTVFDVQAGGSLTLGGKNSGSVIITGDSSVGNPYNFDGDYSLITVSGGTVNIGENTEIKDNKSGRGVNMTSGNLYMTGGTISDNIGNVNGGGVLVGGVGTTFEMSGGKICNNTLVKNSPNSDPRQGGGVCVFGGAIFLLSGDAEIYENSAQDGGAVCVKDGADDNDSIFRMRGGKIYKNNSNGVGAVYIRGAATMYMTGGTISNNTTKFSGYAGGIHIQGATFDGTGARGASVTGNTAGTKSIDISMTKGSSYTPGTVNVGVGP